MSVEFVETIFFISLFFPGATDPKRARSCSKSKSSLSAYMDPGIMIIYDKIIVKFYDLVFEMYQCL